MSLSFIATDAYFFGQSMGRELRPIKLIIRSRSGTSNTPDWSIGKQDKQLRAVSPKRHYLICNFSLQFDGKRKASIHVSFRF